MAFHFEKETNDMKQLTTRQLAMMAFCVILGLIAKRIVSPFTNVLTDFIRLPGGSAAVGFSLAFLVIGREMVPMFRWAATLMGFLQGVLGLMLGFSGYQGIFALLTYTLPGLIIDLTARMMGKRDLAYFLCASVLACISSSLLSNLLVFHLSGLALLMWLLVAACSGIVGGICAQLLYERIICALKIEGRRS